MKKQTWYRTVYLLSDHWKELRSKKLEVSPKCEQCGRDIRLDVHHLKYRKIFDVTVDDLQTLCRRCHKSAHSKKSKRAKRRPRRIGVMRRLQNMKVPSCFMVSEEELPDN